ncbi:MAG: hypothetical protein ACOZB3_01585 [Calditrichota bacterium]
MKLADRFAVVVILIGAAGILIASQPKSSFTHSQTPPKYTVPGWSGRPLTPAESTTISRAIDSIATPPPASIRWRDAHGDTHTVACSTYARVLRAQLTDSGKMQAETKAKASGVVNDGKETTQGDYMNVDSQLIRWSQDSALGHVYLEETLIHEGTHKFQKTNEMTNDEREADALGAELAYKDSCGLAHTNWFYRFKQGLLNTHMANYQAAQQIKRVWKWLQDHLHKVFLAVDPYNTGVDFFCSSVYINGWYEYSLAPWGRMSDMVIFQDHFMIPPGTSIAMLCGTVVPTMTGRIVGFHVIDGMMGPMLFQYDFGPNQGLPPRSFYSMTSRPDGALWYVADTLNHEIVALADVDFADGIPDEYACVYASASWPGFEGLWTMRGVEWAVHPQYGQGIIVSEGQSRDLDAINPYEECWFLPPLLTLDDTAGACLPVSRWQFLNIPPVIQSPLPWAADTVVQLFATWLHSIEVWSTDSLGQTFFEPLCVYFMPHIDGTATLMRPLLAGEFVLPVDATSGARPRLATKVTDPTPRNLTLAYDPDGQLHLRWEAVEGAESYHIYGSADGVNYGWTGDIVDTTEFVLPLLDERFFYQVKAVR